VGKLVVDDDDDNYLSDRKARGGAGGGRGGGGEEEGGVAGQADFDRDFYDADEGGAVVVDQTEGDPFIGDSAKFEAMEASMKRSNGGGDAKMKGVSAQKRYKEYTIYNIFKRGLYLRRIMK
jgi:hypothetical protein